MGGNGSLGGHVAAAASTVTATAAAAWSATTAASAAAFAAASAPTRRHACALRPPGRRLGADVRVGERVRDRAGEECVGDEGRDLVVHSVAAAVAARSKP